jgi:hypothetical protein
LEFGGTAARWSPFSAPGLYGLDLADGWRGRLEERMLEDTDSEMLHQNAMDGFEGDVELKGVSEGLTGVNTAPSCHAANNENDELDPVVGWAATTSPTPTPSSRKCFATEETLELVTIR